LQNSITLRFAGDIMLGGSVLQKIEEHGPLYPFWNLINQMSSSDIFFANLECTLAKNGSPPNPDKILLHTTSSVIQGLKKIGINIVSLANNHTFDYGWKIFRETSTQLNQGGINTIGGGENLKEASQINIFNIKGIRLAFLAYCGKSTGCENFADDNRYGVADVNHPQIYRNVADAKKLSDCVIVSIHWGEEFRDYPYQTNINLARDLIDNGATIVVGHHAHVFQGYEKYKSGLIIYDLGSFIFGDINQSSYRFDLRKRKHREGILVNCELSKDGLNHFNFIPTFINNNFQSSIPGLKTRQKIIKRFYTQSHNIIRDDYERFYKVYKYKFLLSRKISYYTNLFRKAIDPVYVMKYLSNLLKKWQHTSSQPVAEYKNLQHFPE